jgi:DNA-binding NtrC family response regulator
VPVAPPSSAAPQISEPASQAENVAVTEPVDHSLLGDITLDQPLREARDAFERVYFEYHLARENNSMTRVSEKTGLERTHLYRKLKQLGIESRKRSS